jgi:hypothetical protein
MTSSWVVDVDVVVCCVKCQGAWRCGERRLLRGVAQPGVTRSVPGHLVYVCTPPVGCMRVKIVVNRMFIYQLPPLISLILIISFVSISVYINLLFTRFVLKAYAGLLRRRNLKNRAKLLSLIGIKDAGTAAKKLIIGFLHPYWYVLNLLYFDLHHRGFCLLYYYYLLLLRD